MKRIRPLCRRCGKVLDIWFEDGKYHFICNQPKQLFTDEEFWKRVDIAVEDNTLAELENKNES